MAIRCIVKVSQYFDSVTLMTVAREIRGLPGVEDAALLIGTEANKGLLTQANLFAPEAEEATANDLILVIKGTEESLDIALNKAEKLLANKARQEIPSGEQRPRTVRGAVRSHPDANLAVISVPGQFAAAEAWAVLRQGLHVLLFSDNVPLADEVALKRYAVDHDLLMMGPGAGTAIINGVALGFANAVPRGPVGIVSAAGTGLQEVSSLLARQGVGISQAIGVGGRDLSDEVGGMMMLHALVALQADPETEVIIAISKQPSLIVAEKVLAKLKGGDKPTVISFMGDGFVPSPSLQIDNGDIYPAYTLQEAAMAAATLAGDGDLATVKSHLEQKKLDLQNQAQDLRILLKPEQKYLRGLFSGGTLCQEAMRIWGEQIGPIWSNRPFKPEYTLTDSNSSFEHCAMDLGDEEFTIGRPHPMIDNELRIHRLLQEARDSTVAAIQMDVVLGYGAHPDPASELGPAIERAQQIAQEGKKELIILLSITGTDADLQNLSHQYSAFKRSGAIVLESNAAASYLAAMAVSY